MSILTKIARLDKRWIYLLMLVLIVGLYFYPIALPLAVTPYVRDFYNTVEAVPANGVVLISVDITGRQTAEGTPPLVTLLKHLMMIQQKRPITVFFVSANAEGPLMANLMIKQVGMDKAWTYGTQYVNLGWIPSVAGISTFAENIRSIFTVDLYGTPIDSLPMMVNIRNIHDISLMVDIAGQQPGNIEWQGLVIIPYGTNYLYTDLQAHFTAIYYQAKIAKGMIYGIKGTGEYELLIGKPGVGLANASTLSILSLVLLGAFVLCNVGYLGSRIDVRNAGGVKQ